MVTLWTAEATTALWEMLKFTASGLTTLGGAFIGSFLGSYMKKKGENRAIHEDIEKLVDQVRAVTTATKEIEAKISGDVWDRQKRWELKREVLFDATRRLADIEDGLLSLDSVLQVERKERNKEDEPGWIETRHERIMKWSRVSTAFDEARLLVQMICERKTILAFEDFGALLNDVAAKITPGKNAEIYGQSAAERFTKRMTIRAAVRKELGVDG
jgi:hypothetical protein